MRVNKPTVALFFGGEAANHDLSFETGQMVAQHLPRSRYNIVPVHVTADNQWQVPLGTLPTSGDSTRVIDMFLEAVPAVTPAQGLERLMKQPIATFFSVLRGPGGDDGALTSLANTLGIAAVGSPVATCVHTSNKHHHATLVDEIVGSPHTRHFARTVPVEAIEDTVHREFQLPLFVKPASHEGSVGVEEVTDFSNLRAALRHTRLHGDTVVQQRAPGQEVMITLFEDERGHVHVLPPALVTPRKASFYTDAAKRYPGHVALTITSDMSNLFLVEAMAAARDAYDALGCRGLVSVDMMFGEAGPYILEMNTVPTATAHTPLLAQLKAARRAPGAVFETLVQTSLGVNS